MQLERLWYPPYLKYHMTVHLKILNLQPPEFLLDPRPRGIRDLLLDVPSVIDQVFRFIDTIHPAQKLTKKMCRSTPIYEQSSAPPLKAPRGLQGGPLQSESIHSSLDIFKGSGHQKSESVFREFILRLELLSANYITTHLKLLSYSFECL